MKSLVRIPIFSLNLEVSGSCRVSSLIIARAAFRSAGTSAYQVWATYIRNYGKTPTGVVSFLYDCLDGEEIMSWTQGFKESRIVPMAESVHILAVSWMPNLSKEYAVAMEKKMS